MSDADSYINPIEIFDTTVSTSSVGCLMLYGGLTIYNTSPAFSLTQGGTLTSLGGLSINKNSLFGGDLHIFSTTVSTDTSTGSVIIDGGVGIKGYLSVANITVGNLSAVNFSTGGLAFNNISTNDITSATLIANISISTGQLQSINISTSTLRASTGITTSALFSTNITTNTLNCNGTDGSVLWTFNTERPWQFKQSGTGAIADLHLKSTVNGKRFKITDINDNPAVDFYLVTSGNQTTFYGMLSITDTTNSTNVSVGAVVIAGGVGINNNLNVGGITSSANIQGTNISTSSLRVSSTATIATVSATSLTATNMNITGTGTIQNLLTTNITNGSLISNSITTGTLLATTSISTGQLSSINSSTATLNTIGITTGTLLATTSISTGQLSSINSSTATLNSSTGLTSGNALIISNNSAVVGLTIVGANGQTANLQQWENSAGTVLASVNSVGNIYNNDYLLFGRDSYYTDATGASTSSSTTFAAKLTATTGALSGGDYIVLTNYMARAGGPNTARFLESRTILDGSITVATGATPLINTGMSIPTTVFTQTALASGIHTILVDYRTTNAGTSAIIQDVKVWLYRIN